MNRVQAELIFSRHHHRPHLELKTNSGYVIRLDPDRPLPFPGGMLERVRWAFNPDQLPASTVSRVLRTVRRLLAPGGELEVAGSAAQGPVVRSFARLAWLCGFEADVFENDAATCPCLPTRLLRRPERKEPAVPLVSIVIPAYKPAHFREALASAIDQDYQRLDILVCDDSPDDSIRNIVDELSGSRHKVRYKRNPGTIGGRLNYLKCYELAWGDYIKFLNDDDVLAPDCVSRLAGWLRAVPDATLATSRRRLIDHQGKTMADQPFNVPLCAIDSWFDGEDVATLIFGTATNLVGEPSTVMFRKADLRDNTPHAMSYDDCSALRNGDLTMWTTLLSRGGAVVASRPLSDFRQHDQQVQHSETFISEAQRAWKMLAAAAIETGMYRTGMSGKGLSTTLVGTPVDQIPVPSDLLDEAETRFESGDFSAAETLTMRSLRLDPQSARGRNDLACAIWERGRSDEAIAGLAYAACVGAHPDVDANLGAMFEAQGLTDEAAWLKSRTIEPVPSPS
jgi:hypothetical protein